MSPGTCEEDMKWGEDGPRVSLWPVLSPPVFQGLYSKGAKELQLGREVRIKVFQGLSQLLVVHPKEGINVCQERKWMPAFGRDTAVCAFEERKAFLRVGGKVVFPVLGTCPCGSVSNSKYSLIPVCFAWPTQADLASDNSPVCNLIKTENLNHCLGWCVGHLCCSQESESFNLT